MTGPTTEQEAWPQALTPVEGPFSPERIDGAAAGMGPAGPTTRALAADGIVPPDLVTGMTLFLLARQRQARTDPADDAPSSGQPTQSGKAKGSAIAGGVWARERFTIHRPLDRRDRFVVSGASTGRYVRKGSRYGTTTSTSIDSAGRPVATNLTTGLLSYKPVEGLTDGEEGLPLAATPAPGPDWDAAAANPHLDALATAKVGDELGGDEVLVSLAMMAARDTASPDNPIHSDPEAAKAAGLARPIAGGSHVLAFALEPVMATYGPQSLLHGANFDIRWKAPTHADETIVPTARVTSVTSDRVDLDVVVSLVPADGGDRVAAMVGSVAIPLPRTAEAR